MKSKFLVLFLLLTVCSAFKCSKNDTKGYVSSKTPMGTIVIAKPAASAETLTLIDDSLRKLFSDASQDGYANRLEYSQYSVAIRSDCVDRNGVMSWLGDAPNYDGTGYDQHNTRGRETDPEKIAQGFEWKKDGIGKVYRAEEVVMNFDAPTGAGIICLDTPENMANTVRYFGEHTVLFYNDREKYERTKTHLTGGHPLIEERNK